MKKIALYRSAEAAEVAAAEWKKSGYRSVEVLRLAGLHYDFTEAGGVVDILEKELWFVEAVK